MPFGLKNAGSTYQRMMTRMFEQQMGKSVEVYIDDMVVKSKFVPDHIEDLGNVFQILRNYKLRLNATKCSFGVGSEKFLGYMVTHRGIEVNPRPSTTLRFIGFVAKISVLNPKLPADDHKPKERKESVRFFI